MRRWLRLTVIVPAIIPGGALVWRDEGRSWRRCFHFDGGSPQLQAPPKPDYIFLLRSILENYISSSRHTRSVPQCSISPQPPAALPFVASARPLDFRSSPMRPCIRQVALRRLCRRRDHRRLRAAGLTCKRVDTDPASATRTRSPKARTSRPSAMCCRGVRASATDAMFSVVA